MSVNHVCLDETLDMIEIAADLYSTSSVCVLSWLHNPERVAILGILLQHFIVLRIVVDFLKLQEFSISLTLFNVISQRQCIKWILSNGLVVDLHIVVDGLFIT